MIRRQLRRVRGRAQRELENLRLRLLSRKADRAARALPPRRSVPADPAAQTRELLRRLSRDLTLDRLTRLGLQSDSPVVYDALALRASFGRLDLAQLVAKTDAAGLHLEPIVLVELARVLQQHAHPETGSVLDLALAVHDKAGQGALLLLAQLLLLEQRTADARRVLDTLGHADWQGERLRSDLLNPFAGGPGTEQEWIASVAGIYRATGVEPITLAPAADAGEPSYRGEPFDRLATTVAPGSVSGPMVSVIMSTFRPGPYALASARSILDQSWREIELLVMDDASGPEYDAVLDELAALDPRVRVVRAERNGGTYVRRNDALQIARGEYVTMQDSDDWSHPRRLELQVRHLEAHPALPANLIVSLRMSNDLLFTQRRGLQPRLCEPALLFRRELVVGRIGYFDSVRKSADSEYRVRISQSFGGDVPVIHPQVPLMLMRFDSASLSGSDFGDGWTHPVRFSYRSAYLRWQERELEQGRTPRIGFPLEKRPFPALPRITGEPQLPQRYRLIVAGDGRRQLDGRESGRIAALLQDSGIAASELAFLQLGAIRSTQPHLLAPELQDLINSGAVSELCLGDEAEVETLVIAHADAVLGLPSTAKPLRADRIVLLVDSEARLSDGRNYAAELLEDACRRVFGLTPEWADSYPA